MVIVEIFCIDRRSLVRSRSRRPFKIGRLRSFRASAPEAVFTFQGTNVKISYMIEKFELVESELTQIEPTLRDFITQHSLGSQLISEVNIWDEHTQRPRLHMYGIEHYKFEKMDPHKTDVVKYWPMRSVRWQEGSRCALIQIFANEELTGFKLWSVIGPRPFGLFDFQEIEDLDLPENVSSLPQMLEERYRKLQAV